MAREVQQFMRDIDDLVLYQKDYNIIRTLLECGDPDLFAVILEGVLNGDLYWSDFDTIFAETNYNKLVVDILDIQQKIREEYSRLNELRASLYGNINMSLADGVAFGMYSTENDTNETLKNREKTLESELDNIRETALYEITKITPNDNELSILCKIKIFNQLQIQDDSDKDKINYRDLFLFINDFLLPLDIRYQVLDSNDIVFMTKHGLTETEMKKYKALKVFLRVKE